MSFDFSGHLPENVVGVINYNNLNVNILDVKKIFNKDDFYKITSKIVILKSDDVMFGLLVDIVEDIKIFDKENIKNNFHSGDSPISAFYYFETEDISIINLKFFENEILKEPVESDLCSKTSNLPNKEEEILILEERKNLFLSRQNSMPSDSFWGEEKYLVCEIDREKFCIKSEFIKEILLKDNLKITKLPVVDDYILGIFHYRGNFVSILDCAKFLNLSFNKKDEKHEKVVIINSKEFNIAFLFDETINFIDIPIELITKKMINKNSFELINDVVCEGEILSVLNIENILKDDRLYINHNL